MKEVVAGRRAGRTRLGLPPGIRACLFDLDGVLTQTAALHSEAWKQMFDGYLLERAERLGEPFIPFDRQADYLRYVDGKHRADGVRSFLESRGISLPEGTGDDPPSAETIGGLGNRKNELVLQLMETRGVTAFEGSRRYLEAVKQEGMLTAVVSASANTAAVLRSAGLEDVFDVRVDGLVAAREGLRGKPFPDTFLRAARELEVEPGEAAVFEDAIAGVHAGRDGGFGFVVGVDRARQAAALTEAGADVVVTDLAQLMETS
ncbi:MAG: beta-phosphoglucomutase family hydrolase [Actinomycetota bacterium]|nr:beta-phosphoglucomutase family hydrolase [Actinomycetota bacterium]